jgi:hypothetical protein
MKKHSEKYLKAPKLFQLTTKMKDFFKWQNHVLRDVNFKEVHVSWTQPAVQLFWDPTHFWLFRAEAVFLNSPYC